MEERIPPITPNSGKQRRSENFTNAEKLLMIKILENFVAITENKATDGSTCKQKDLAWQKITSSFNNSTSGMPRALPQLQSLWKNMKQKFKNQAEVQQYKAKTGQLPPPPEMLEILKKLYEHPPVLVALDMKPSSDIPTTVQPLYNPYDCDAGVSSPLDIAENSNGLGSPHLNMNDNAADMITLTEVPDESANPLFKMAQEEHSTKMKLLRAKVYNAKRRMEMEEELHAIKKKRLLDSWVLT